MKQVSKFLPTKEAARFLGLSWRTLEDMRHDRTGPPYRQHGRRIYYHLQDLQDWSRYNSSHIAGKIR